MKTQSIVQRTQQALFITGISIFALAPALAKDSVQVTAENYVRAESDFQMKGYIAQFNCFGKFAHSRKPYDVKNQVTVRGNRDTLYSFGVFDLMSPLTVTLPDPKGAISVLDDCESGSFDLGRLRSRASHSDGNECWHSIRAPDR